MYGVPAFDASRPLTQLILIGVAVVDRKPPPALVVIGVSDLPEDGPGRATCMGCGKEYPVQLSTALTLAQAKNDGRKLIVGCFSCIQASHPTLVAEAEVIGIRKTRKRMGTDN